MTANPTAPAAMPGEEDVARLLMKQFYEQWFAPHRPAYHGSVYWDFVNGESAWGPSARAVLALFAPILAEKEREIAECAPYLKDGETPRQRMDRDHADREGLMRLLEQERRRTEALALASLRHESGERITRKDLNNAYRKGQEDGRMFEKITNETEVELKPGWLKRDTEKAAARVKEWDSVHEYVERYEFRGDQDYTPNEHEKALIEDAINGYVGAMRNEA